MYVILGSNSNSRVQVFGDRKGTPFQDEETAERAMKRLDTRFRHLDFVVLPLSELPSTTVQPV